MTPEDRTPRKRRRRRRRTGGAGAEGGQTAGNGHRPEPGNEAVPPAQYRGGGGSGGGAGRNRRRRSRGRGRPGDERRPQQENGSSAPPIDVAPGELTAVSGVLFIKQNGTGILVDPANSYHQQPGDPIVPR